MGIRPVSTTDPILAYPERLDQLQGKQLLEFVRRFEEAFRRAARYIVQHDLSGLPATKAAFEGRERVELQVEPDGSELFGAIVHGRSKPSDGPDDVVTVEPDGERSAWDWGWADLAFNYSSPSDRVYREVRTAVAAELSGENALGEQAL